MEFYLHGNSKIIQIFLEIFKCIFLLSRKKSKIICIEKSTSSFLTYFLKHILLYASAILNNDSKWKTAIDKAPTDSISFLISE